MVWKRLLLILLGTAHTWVLSAASSQGSSTPLEVVFAGLGRTGSHSLEAALERLGYNGCHGNEVALDITGEHAALADAIIDQDVDALLEITAAMGYNATLEVHGAFWREIRQQRPDAKYIFIIREFESWYASMLQMYATSKRLFRFPLSAIAVEAKIASFLAAVMSQQLNVTQEEARDLFTNTASEHHAAVHQRAHERYVQEALAITKAHPKNTLLFDHKQGYPALCRFLHISECPSEAFPHLSSRRYMKGLEYFTMGLEVAVVVAPLLLLYLTYKLGRWFLSPSKKKVD